MKLCDLHLRDPYILPFDGKYYLLFSPGKFAWEGCEAFYVTISEDLEEWSEPIKCFDPPEGFWANNNFWAPEMHYYKGSFYIFASFGAKVGHKRVSQILKADRPEGPFEVWSCPITPSNMSCIDGTLYVEDGVPYMVYSHEVIDIPDNDGEMWCVRLSDDLKEPVGQPWVLFKGSEPSWTEYKFSLKEQPRCVAEGAFFHRTKDGKLLMIWSSHYGPGCYIEAVSYSSNGSIKGEWIHCKDLLLDNNAGHGMLFNTFDGDLKFTFHYPNTPFGEERAQVYSVEETTEEPFLKIVK
ncbi:MAG: family 43 glycosylhydrolase [Clostridia bacterium]|nr:family 43 glycosylhydrolase [Clostridia bacterium]